MNTTEFIEKANQVHNNKYDYSESIYVLSRVKLKIKCPIHGTFEQRANGHLNGRGCRECKKSALSQLRKLDQQTFFEKCKLVHGDKYDYSLTVYESCRGKVTIICLEHGQFNQSPADHLRGKGCSKCGYNLCRLKHTLQQEEFIKRAVAIHGLKYDYSEACYQTMHKNLIIQCPKHGRFQQTPLNHLHGKNGCPKCKESKGEIRIRQFLESQNLNFISQWKSESCKSKKSLPFDFMVEINNIKHLIEFQGEQHYRIATGIWKGSQEQLTAIKQRDKIKETWCENNAIPLLVIKYNDFDLIEQKVKLFLSLC